MQLAEIFGTASASVKHPSLKGTKLMLIDLLGANGESEGADPLIAIDLVGAGPGDVVMITSDAPTIRDALGSENAPVRWSIIGVRDA